MGSWTVLPNTPEWSRPGDDDFIVGTPLKAISESSSPGVGPIVV